MKKKLQKAVLKETAKVDNTGNNFSNIWSFTKTNQEKRKETDFSWTGGQNGVWEMQINGGGADRLSWCREGTQV